MGELKHQLSPVAFAHTAVEVANWSTKVGRRLNEDREGIVNLVARSLDYVTTGDGDVHHVWVLGKQTSQFEASRIAPESLTNAVRDRTIRPSRSEPLARWEWTKLVATTMGSTILHKTVKLRT